MRSVPTLFVREWKSFFFSPTAYIVITVFLALAGYFFFGNLSFSRQATLRPTLDVFAIVLLFVTPIITMRLLAEEARSGTIETLLTAPVRDVEVVLGKFFASLAFLICMLLPTGYYVAVLAKVGSPDYGQIISGYIGLVLVGCVFLSVGLLCSAATKNQIVAAVVAFVALLILWILGALGQLAQQQGLKELLEYIGFFRHFDSFQKGLIDTRDVIYMLSVTTFCLFLTVRVVETRKWR